MQVEETCHASAIEKQKTEEQTATYFKLSDWNENKAL